ncbi:hypothetical protein I5498_21945 [Citrobacter amalonaticus]|nr:MULTISPECIES: hypothetical protein [Citrobacter]EKW5095536.1 hypothetical protein [Citrobacter amalonaticus]MBC6535772.1 hypothetical protein [Citrobacter amalonaticus]MBJ9320443.1 hypothetical protein [Citrobacter amalonaticus]MDB2168406.1 hypothetical protein [Citrobacter farmeri]MZK90359.1 hypothetical protein [Citrobacter amalonaticus]
MASKKLKIPFDTNKNYYNGIRGVLSGIVCSMIGVYITGLFSGAISFTRMFEMPIVIISAWVALCAFLWAISYKFEDRVICTFGRNWDCPRTANIFLFLLYIMIGVFCSLIFEAFLKGSASRSLYISMAGFLVFLRLFCFFSIKNYSQIQSKSVDENNHDK